MYDEIRFKGLGSKNPELHFSSADQWVDFALASATGATTDILTPELYNTLKSNIPVIYHNEYMFNNAHCESNFYGYTDGARQRDRLISRKCNDDIRLEIQKNALELPALSTDIQAQELDNTFYDESGLYFDSSAYYSGEENCMINYAETETEKQIIWIACSIGGLAAVKPVQFLNRGTALIVAVHALERAGVAVGVIGYSNAQEDGGFNNALQTVVVKQPHMALDETTLINVFAEVGTYRSIGFHVRTILTLDNEMGGSKSVTEKQFDLSYAGGEKIVILPYKDTDNYKQLDTAIAYTLTLIKNQTGV